jgi:2-methylcitrate dehydratase PrpD
MIAAFECHPLTGTHASGTVLPALLALAERDHAGGKDFLVALVVGAEVSARLARTAVALESERGFHNPGVLGPLAAAAAVGNLRRLKLETIVNALGIAGSSSGGLLEFAWAGADTKRIHEGRASQLGLESALLAEAGLTGPATVLEGRYGLFNAFFPARGPERHYRGTGRRLGRTAAFAQAIPGACKHPGCRRGHPGLQARASLQSARRTAGRDRGQRAHAGGTLYRQAAGQPDGRAV